MGDNIARLAYMLYAIARQKRNHLESFYLLCGAPILHYAVLDASLVVGDDYLVLSSFSLQVELAPHLLSP